MLRDELLKCGKDARPTITPAGAIPFPYLFPNANLVTTFNVNSIDLKVATHLGNGRPLIARFDIKQTFAGAADTVLSFIVSAATDELHTSGRVTIQRTAALAQAVLIAQTSYQIVLPPSLGPLAATGRRYLALGMEVAAPTSDFSAGAVDAHFMLDGEGDIIKYASGYTV